MPQFFPDGPAAVNLNAINDRGGINLPPEPPSEFETPGMQGSMQQLLSENLGKFVLADFLVGVSNIVRRVGILYSVGRGFLVIYSEAYHAFQVCDIFSLKFISFFPPGSEPSIEDLLSGEFTSGIIRPGTGGLLAPETSGGTFAEPSGRSTSGMGMGMGNSMNTGMGNSMNAGMGSSMNTGMNNGMGSGMSSSNSRGSTSSSGCRTLGQR